jgi:hypothetical protein
MVGNEFLVLEVGLGIFCQALWIMKGDNFYGTLPISVTTYSIL